MMSVLSSRLLSIWRKYLTFPNSLSSQLYNCEMYHFFAVLSSACSKRLNRKMMRASYVLLDVGFLHAAYPFTVVE
jgi:hypothetical protein